MKSFKKPWFNLFIAVVSIIGFMGLQQGAAYGASADGWKWKGDAGVGFAYDTNVYKFSTTQSNRFDANSTSDQTSGRYADMDSDSDFIFTPRLRAAFRHTSPNGGAFSLKPSIAYKIYSQNTEKNYFKFGLGLTQEVGAHGVAGLDLAYSPSIFKKNYLSGTADIVNGFSPGTSVTAIQSAEEIFTAANYDKARATVSYGMRLWKNGNKDKNTYEVERVSGHVLAGYESKSYDDPFSVRDEDSYFAGFDAELALYKSMNLTFNYLFKSTNTDVGTELLLRDEPDFGVDLNADGDALDLSVATLKNVDRSRNMHTLGLKTSARIADGWKGYAKYEVRFAAYKSDETFDVTRIDRNDTRQKVGVGIKGKLAPRWNIDFGWTFTHNEAARDGLAVTDKAEAKSYNKHVISALLSYRF
ncbi:MAG: hypothetical protein ACE5DW_01205 [Thermodesulfobacteriota bacterium]